jgi:hypothetical protein
MSAKSLALLLNAMAANPGKIRWLNISFNSIGKIEEPPQVSLIEDASKKKAAPKKKSAPEPEKTGPEQFMEALKLLLAETCCLNHLDISGMSIQRPQILDLCHAMSKCPVLLSVHMSELMIN